MDRVTLLKFNRSDGRAAPGEALQVRGDDIGRHLLSLPCSLRGLDCEEDSLYPPSFGV